MRYRLNFNHSGFPYSFFFLLFFSFFSLVGTAATPPPAVGSQGIVASRSLLASKVGIDIMKQGGNAIDAAVAVGFALAVTYPSAGNLGGGGFMVIRLANGEDYALDFREVAPELAHPDMYLDDKGKVVKGLSTIGHLSAGVPGSVDGLLKAQARFGNLTRKQVIAPAFYLANDGFILPRDLAEQFSKQLPAMASYPASTKIFSNKGKPYKAGDKWIQLDLAYTLKIIANKGREGFYDGKVAKLITKEMQAGGGKISLDDLKNYQSLWRDPIKSTYRGYTIIGMPPPSSGGILIAQMLNMIEPYNIKELGWGSAELVHLMIEAQRRAYADRAIHLGDPDFYQVPQKKLTSKEYARLRFKNFNPEKANTSDEIGSGSWGKESNDTTHYSVMDAKGNAVSVTTTLNLAYGNKIVVPGTGFLLNNEMDDFSSKPGVPNAYGLLGSEANKIEPGKRMLSSMSPTIVLKGNKPFLVTGSPGGSTIINTSLQVILNVLDHGMSLNDAVGLPRFHHQWQPDKIFYEPYAISPDTLKALKTINHTGFIKSSRLMGDANSVMLKNISDEVVLYGASDPRNAGGVSAY